MRLYKGREDTRWGRERLAELRGDQLDAVALLAVAESEVLAPLDLAAQREVEAAARQVATVTALVPIALTNLLRLSRPCKRLSRSYRGEINF